jgi:hypothetical protein
VTEFVALDNFDRVLSILHGWIGRQVGVSVNAAGGPEYLASFGGRLKAGADMVEMAAHPLGDEDFYAFGFEEAPDAEFMVHRRSFKGASFNGSQLSVSMGSYSEVYVSITLADTSA